MQILRFEDAPEVAPKRKKSSAGWIGLGLAAALFGVSTAFASSSIRINDAQPINLAQGVVAVTGCDPFIGLKPITILKDDMTNFAFESLEVGSAFTDAGANDYAIDTDAAPDGCGGVDFKVQFFPKPTAGVSPVALTCAALLSTTPTGSDYGAINGFLDLDGGPVTLDGGARGLKCDDNAIYFRVSRSTETLNFITGGKPGGFDPAIFDYITLESTNTTY
jgi:hypothetical protein